jgi:hypothetical protein
MTRPSTHIGRDDTRSMGAAVELAVVVTAAF